VIQANPAQERLIATYRKKAKHYDVTSRLYPAPPCERSAFTRVTAWSTSPAAPA
jgi:hypothetical protein